MNDKPNDGEMEKSNYIDNINYFLLLFLLSLSPCSLFLPPTLSVRGTNMEKTNHFDRQTIVIT